MVKTLAFACLVLIGTIQADCVNSGKVDQVDPSLEQQGLRFFNQSNNTEQCPFESQYKDASSLTEVRLYRQIVEEIDQNSQEGATTTISAEYMIGSQFMWTSDDGEVFSCSSGLTDGQDYVSKTGTDLQVIQVFAIKGSGNQGYQAAQVFFESDIPLQVGVFGPGIIQSFNFQAEFKLLGLWFNYNKDDNLFINLSTLYRTTECGCQNALIIPGQNFEYDISRGNPQISIGTILTQFPDGNTFGSQLCGEYDLQSASSDGFFVNWVTMYDNNIFRFDPLPESYVEESFDLELEIGYKTGEANKNSNVVIKLTVEPIPEPILEPIAEPIVLQSTQNDCQAISQEAEERCSEVSALFQTLQGNLWEQMLMKAEIIKTWFDDNLAMSKSQFQNECEEIYLETIELLYECPTTSLQTTSLQNTLPTNLNYMNNNNNRDGTKLKLSKDDKDNNDVSVDTGNTDNLYVELRAQNIKVKDDAQPDTEKGAGGGVGGGQDNEYKTEISGGGDDKDDKTEKGAGGGKDSSKSQEKGKSNKNKGKN